MEINFDYYLIRSTYPNNVPLLINDDESDSQGVRLLSRYQPIAADIVARVAFGPPIPPKPRLADAMSLRGTCNVFSKKIYDVLSQHTIKGIQLIPAIIRGKNDEKFDNYWIANIHQKMAFFDEKETVYTKISSFTGTWEGVKKIVLDKIKLLSVPLEDRLVFVAKEKAKFILYHKSVADIIMSVNPEGVCFTPVEKWCEGEQFD